MQTIIREYGHSIVQGIVFSTVIVLLITGLSLFGSMRLMSDGIDKGMIKAEAGSGEKALKSHLDKKSDNLAISGDVYVGRDQRIYYEKDSDENPIRLRNGNAKRIHINAVYLLRNNVEDNDGYEVTDQVLSEDMTGDSSYLSFKMPGTYRLSVSVTDSDSVVSNYQFFMHVGARRVKI